MTMHGTIASHYTTLPTTTTLLQTCILDIQDLLGSMIDLVSNRFLVKQDNLDLGPKETYPRPL